MKGKHRVKQSKNINTKIIIIVIMIIILISSSSYLVYHFYNEWKNKEDMQKLSNAVDEAIINDNAEGNMENIELLNELQELKKENSDLIGWLKIEGTNINYPVLQKENDNDYYANHNFKKEVSELGSIFLDKDCGIENPTDNFLIYGHRNTGGQMFETLTNYKEESFYTEHPTFQFATLDEVSEYQIIAVFQSQVYLKSQNVFKYYFFKDAKNKEEFDEYIENVKRLSIYEIEETANYGDQLITLSTCDYHTEDGRFAVVAKKINKNYNNN